LLIPIDASGHKCLEKFSPGLKKGDSDGVAWNRKGPPLLCPRRESDEEITMELINSEFTQDSFPHQLLLSLLKEEKDISYKALQKAYDVIREIKNEN